MRNLLDFLYRYRTFGLFLLLEVFCAWLIIKYNNRYNASFLNSSNVVAASISQLTQDIENYFTLTEVNEQLLSENEKLRNQLLEPPTTFTSRDSVLDRYEVVRARVINNTFNRSMNFLTLDVGSRQGIQPGMGVIAGTGIIGQVKSVSKHFSTVISLLHQNLMVSSFLKRTNTLCTVQWDGVSPIKADVKYIPKHISLYVGDTVVTSDFNAVFPPGIMMGIISKLNVKPEDVYYEAELALSTDFTSLSYAYVILDALKAEKDSIESTNLLQ